jgi:ethanolamine phosphate phosphodiesterase
MWLTKVFTDRYMRRNYRYLRTVNRPGMVIFLGDLMDGGREWEDEKWHREYARFWRVFPTQKDIKQITLIPGNHDIGLGNGINLDHLDRFKQHFTNDTGTSASLSHCSHQLVLLDTPSLLNTDTPEVANSPMMHLDNLGMENGGSIIPRLLLTHIPLWRAPDANCGSQRESTAPLREGGGYQYQNMLDLPMTTRILDILWPIQGAFSGDDHDYCEVEHEVEGRREVFTEYTVKSFSWAMVHSPSLPLSLRASFMCGLGFWLWQTNRGTGNQVSWIPIIIVKGRRGNKFKVDQIPYYKTRKSKTR